MSETEDFLAAMIPRQVEADTALHNGDVAPRMALWLRRDPVTVLGAAVSATGWDDIGRYRREDGEWKIAHRHGDAATVVELPRPSGEMSTNP